MEIINLTPHSITIVGENGSIGVSATVETFKRAGDTSVLVTPFSSKVSFILGAMLRIIDRFL